jgi:hypothetical protein
MCVDRPALLGLFGPPHVDIQGNLRNSLHLLSYFLRNILAEAVLKREGGHVDSWALPV